MRIGKVVLKNNRSDIADVSHANRRIFPVGHDRNLLNTVAGERYRHNWCYQAAECRPQSQKTTAELIKAQIINDDGIGLYDNLTQMAHEILRSSAVIPDLKQLKLKRNVSATCIKTSQETFSLDKGRLHMKKSMSQQIVMPKTAKLHEEILYLLRDVPLKPSKDPKERMIRKEVLKKLFRKLRHLTHKMQVTESDEDLLRNIKNCLQSVFERYSRNKHWENRKSDNDAITQFQMSSNRVTTQHDVILKTLITDWFNSIELKVISSQERDKFLRNFIKQQQNQFSNRPKCNSEYREHLDASVIDFLRKLPILTDPECKRIVIIHRLTAKLVQEIMNLAKPTLDINVPVSLREPVHLNIFKDDYYKEIIDIQPVEKELNNVIVTELRKTCSIENVEQTFVTQKPPFNEDLTCTCTPGQSTTTFVLHRKSIYDIFRKFREKKVTSNAKDDKNNNNKNNSKLSSQSINSKLSLKLMEKTQELSTTTIERTKRDRRINAYEERLGEEIKGWIHELPEEIKQKAILRADSETVSMLVKDIYKSIEVDQESTCDTVCDVIEKEVPPWLSQVLQSTDNKVPNLNSCIESLKARIQAIPITNAKETACIERKSLGEKDKTCVEGKDAHTDKKNHNESVNHDAKEECKHGEDACEESNNLIKSKTFEEKAEARVELSGMYDYPISYCAIRRLLNEWSKRANFTPRHNKKLLSEQLDNLAHSLHKIIVNPDLTSGDVTRSLKHKISNAIYTLPLTIKSKYGHEHVKVIEDIWSHIKQNKAQNFHQIEEQQEKQQNNAKIYNKPVPPLILGDVCFQCCSASSHASEASGTQNRNLRFTEPKVLEAARNDPPDAFQSLQEPSNRHPVHHRCHNTIDGQVWSDKSRIYSTMKKTTDTNRRDALNFNKTMQEPLNKFTEGRRRYSIAESARTADSSAGAKAGDCCGAIVHMLTPDKIDDELQHYLSEWCEKVPIENVGQDIDVTKIRQGLYNGIGMQIIKIRSDPLAIQDRFLTEDMLDGELESLLNCLPQTPNLSEKRTVLKYELMEYVVNNNQKLCQVFSSQGYRQQLKEALDKTLPKPKPTSAELEILQDIIKENLIDDFIQANYNGMDHNKRMLFHTKIQQELSRLVRELSQNRQSEPVNLEVLRTEFYDALYKVPVPSEETMLEHVKECLLREEISGWYKNLPISHTLSEEDHHNHSYKNLLAKKIIEIEKQANRNDINVDENIKHEISKFINKFHLRPDEDLNINAMVDELANRMKNNPALRDASLNLSVSPTCHKDCNSTLSDVRNYHEFSEYKPLSSTLDPQRYGHENYPLSSSLDPKRQMNGGALADFSNVSGIAHDTPLDMSINMRAPTHSRFPQSPQDEYPGEFSQREKSQRQQWKNASSAVKRHTNNTKEDSKQWVSLEEVEDSEREFLRQEEHQERREKSCGQQSACQQSNAQQSFGEPNYEQQIRGRQNDMLPLDSRSYSRVQENNIDQNVANVRRALGTSQLPGPSCCDRNLKASDVLFRSVMEWCHQIPFTPAYPENGKQLARAEIATKLISKVGELNLDPNVLQDGFLYEGMLHSVVDHILDITPQSIELKNMRMVLKESIVQHLLQARLLAIQELEVHNYRREVNDTITKLCQPGSGKAREKSIVNSTDVEKIADALMEMKYEENEKKQCKKKLIEAMNTYNAESTAKKIDTKTQEKLAEALVNLPAPTKEALAEEVEEVKLKNEINDWYKKIPLLPSSSTTDDLQTTNKMISLLAKELHELEKESPELDNQVNLLKAELNHWIKRLPVNPHHTCKVNQLVDEFANRLLSTQKSRRLTSQRQEMDSSCPSYRTSASLPTVKGDKTVVNPRSSVSMNRDKPCSQSTQHSCLPNMSRTTSDQPQRTPRIQDQSQNTSFIARRQWCNQRELSTASQNTSSGRPPPPYTYNIPRQPHNARPQNEGPQFCHAPHHSCKHSPPHHLRHQMGRDSEAPADEESFRLHCKCHLPPCQERARYFFTPPCHLYVEAKQPMYR